MSDRFAANLWWAVVLGRPPRCCWRRPGARSSPDDVTIGTAVRRTGRTLPGGQGTPNGGGHNWDAGQREHLVARWRIKRDLNHDD